MSGAEERRARLESAQHDLEDIKALQKSQPFERYFLRRLKSKQAAIEERFRNEPPSKVDAHEREILRRLAKEYDELLKMMAVDENSCIDEITRSTREGPI